ncbi:hypothetical protein M430DRAFT_170303 [Amorphotheca resinae ATCC 22711]|uniref:Uncharacterized protein n=1 Tax=Amorphotheca resinae ATCC 22711 TaxID=857342 RepID=A0A2T3AUN6_AMORE|nr:hypothetical protein M430DRAFT_170303 [Amorphotheca resinae ATCC 22711]PSS12390.1 hypothetical protein M430DRAFT_170303 [Amorphotheca resinae ATCC 22711]
MKERVLVHSPTSVRCFRDSKKRQEVKEDQTEPESQDPEACVWQSGRDAQFSLVYGPKKLQKRNEHTTVGIRWWSPTQLLIYRSEAYVWQSGRDAQFSSVCGRM